MKRLAIFIFVIPLILTGCTKEPYADFNISRQTVYVGDVIYFTNRSMDARSYEWDFGDGYSSRNFNVSHFYDSPGRYTVTLSAFGRDDRVDVYRLDITVLASTGDLTVVVKEYFDEYVVPDASVILYPSLADWENQENEIIEGFTNANGEVTFYDLDADRSYYVDVYEQYHDNYQLEQEDPKWVETQVITAGELNVFVAYVDYYPPSKKSGTTREEARTLHHKLVPDRAPRIKAESK